MQCKAIILINNEGVEYLAKGAQPYSWNYRVIAQGEDGEPLHPYDKVVLEKGVKIGEGTIDFPTREQIAGKAVEILKEELQAKQAESYKECQAIQQRIDDILMIENKPTVTAIDPMDKDIPF